MTLRPAVPADAASLDALERTLFTAENYPLSRAMFYYHIRNNLLLVAETDAGEIGGYLLALVKRREPKLYSLAVAPAFRQQGIATLLLSAMFGELHARGVRRCVLEVRTDNAGAIALYLRHGFHAVKTIKGFYKDGCDALFMRRDVEEKAVI